MDKGIIIFWVVLLFTIGSIKAQTSESFSKAVIGSWNGTGTLFEQEASFQMRWENSLNSKFIKLTFKNSFKSKSGMEVEMSAHAYYQLELNRGYWFDSRGIMLPLKLEINEDSMTVLWGDASSESGKTVYSIGDSNHLIVQDFVLKEDSYVLFGKATYIRIEK